MSWPNRITLARIFLIGPLVIALLNINEPSYQPWARYGALTIFVVIALSDALDGYLARRTDSVTMLGTFLDPLADKLLITCCCLLLATEKTAIVGMKLPAAVVVLIIGKDLYITLGFVVIYLITSQMKIVTVMAGKIATATQLFMVLAILISPEIIGGFPGFQYVIWFLWYSAALLAVITVFVYTRNGAAYLSEFERQLIDTAQEDTNN